MRFIRKVLKEHPRLVIFVDNAPWHRGKAIKKFCRKHGKTLRLFYFPSYSPELNPVEQHWKVTKKALSNRVLRTIPATQYRVRNTLSRKDLMPKMFQYLIN
jgi:transposase